MDVVSKPKFCWVSVLFLLQRGWRNRAMDSAVLKPHLSLGSFFLLVLMIYLFFFFFTFSLQSSFTPSTRNSVVKREVSSHAWNNKGEENTVKKNPELMRALVSVTVYIKGSVIESSGGFDCWEDKHRPPWLFLRLFVWKTVGFGVITSQISP